MSMSLRDRTKGGIATPPNELAAPAKAATTTKRVAKPKSKAKEKEKLPATKGETKTVESSADEQSSTEATKKLPRVILKLGPKPTDGQLPASVSEQSS